jgi:hypothetical protein
LPPISSFNAFYLAEVTLPNAVVMRHFDDMGLEKIEIGTRSERGTPCRLCRRSLQERESVSTEKIAQTAREPGSIEQVSEKGNGGYFSTHQHTEQELFMFEQAILPRIQSGNCDAEMLTDCRYGSVSFEIGD